MATGVRRMKQLGQPVWLHGLSRELLRPGRLDHMIERDGIAGVIVDPRTLLDSLDDDADYAAELGQMRDGGWHPRDALSAVVASDVRRACDLLKGIWDGGEGRVGWVSVPTNPGFAHDRRRLVAEAKRIRGAVRRANLMVGIPATRSGIAASEDCVASGISVHTTMVFSAERHLAVVNAYLRGLARFMRAGGAAYRVAGAVSFPIPVLDAAVAARTHRPVRSVGVALARAAYRTFSDVFSSNLWEAFSDGGANPQWCMWDTASGDPDRDVKYVGALVSPHTTTAVSESTLRMLRGVGEIRPTLADRAGSADAVLRELRRRGIDMDALADELLMAQLDALTTLVDETECVVGRLSGEVSAVR